MIPAQPCGEIIELVAIGQNRGKANNPLLVRVRTAKKPLNLRLIAHVTLIETDHVALVEYEETNVIEGRWIIAQRELELLRRRYLDVPLPDRVLVEAADPDAAVERRDCLAEWAEGPLQRGFRLGRKRT